jgi:hypothetical protein
MPCGRAAGRHAGSGAQARRLTGALLKPGHSLSEDGWRHANRPSGDRRPRPVPIGHQGPARLWSTLQPGTPAPAQPGWLARVQVTGAAPQPGPATPMSGLFGLYDPVADRTAEPLISVRRCSPVRDQDGTLRQARCST